MGVFARPWLIDSATGNFTDLMDNRPFSTEFSHTRFLVPRLMQYKGWALFMDSDMIFMSDIVKLFALRNDKYAVMCVKHLHQPMENAAKMDGRVQLRYHRKNWSSFVLWNCAHEANRCMTASKINFMSGSELHAFEWLQDSLIGDLPFSYNYISGVSPRNTIGHGKRPDVVHYTAGGPWFDECKDVAYAPHWIDEYENWQSSGMGNKINDAMPSLSDGNRMQKDD